MNRVILILSTLSVSINSYAFIGHLMSGGVIAAVVGFITQFFLACGQYFIFQLSAQLEEEKIKI